MFLSCLFLLNPSIYSRRVAPLLLLFLLRLDLWFGCFDYETKVMHCDVKNYYIFVCQVFDPGVGDAHLELLLKIIIEVFVSKG